MKSKIIFFIIIFIFIGTFLFGESNKFIERSTDCVVTVKTENSLGSGFVVSQDGYIVTCAHVVKDLNEVNVAFGENEFPAVVKAIDNDLDVALLKINRFHLPCLVLGNSDKVGETEEVFAIGSPQGLDKSVTKGIISAKSRKLNENSDVKYFQIDVVINPGSSGGPLLNEKGEAVGINVAIDQATGDYGFSLPINYISDFLGNNGVAYVQNLNDALSEESVQEENNESDGGQNNAPAQIIPKKIKANPWLLAGSCAIIVLIMGCIVFFVLKTVRKKKQKTIPRVKPVDNYDDINIALGNTPVQQNTPKDNYDDIDIEFH